ncbi:hypothetical protein M0P25_04495 [archaeon]|nr:hypothetical protein [archaeon]
MVEAGFYIIDDSFYLLVNDPYLKGNDRENRPHCYCIERDDFLWMIPMSSKISKYSSIINRRTEEGKPNDIFHIAVLDDGNESVFLIGDIFPTKKRFIKREYTIGTNHFRITSENLKKEILNKANKVIMLLEKGVKFSPTQANIQLIKEKLTDDQIL